MTKDPNKNRLGYKKTKVGWIPKDWECKHLHHYSSKIGSGCTPKGGRDTYLHEGIPFIRSQNVHNGSFMRDGLVYISEEQHEKMKGTQVRPFDVLYNITGASIGRCCIFPEELKEANVNQHVCIVRTQPDLLFPEYLCALLNSDIGRRQLYENQAGGGREGLNFENLRSFRISIPTLPEQKKIAEILSTWDDTIEQTHNLLDAKKRQKKALMQQLPTGKKRGSNFIKSSEYFKHRFFEIPRDWGYPKIGEIAKECTERNQNSEQLTVLSCSKHKGFVESAQYFGKQVFSEDRSNYKVIKKGWFGYPSNHIEEGSIGLLQKHNIGIVSPIYTIFRTSPKVIPEYFYALFKTETFRHIFQISTNASVDRRGSLRWNEFSLIHVPLPSKEEQRYIVNVLSASDYEINNLENKLIALKKQKRGLMQKLLTGQIRVKV